MAVWLAAVFLAVIVVALFCMYFFCRREGSKTHFDRAAASRPVAIKIAAEAAEVADAVEAAEAVEASKASKAAEAVRAAAKQHREFTYAELIKATGSFTTKLGNGKFGEVYKGRLEGEDGNKWVAVKEMKNLTDTAAAQKDFITEVNNAGKLMHRNLVQLIGYCFEPQNQKLLIVFDFVNNGTLEDYLFSSPAVLSWENRHKIVLGLAAGIEYLHFGCKQSMIHRDIKPENVMLDDDFNPQLGDFGLSRFTEHNQSMKSTLLAGTIGYIAPQVLVSGKATLASDVYTFGLVLLQTVTGRKELEVQEQKVKLLLVSWVWMLNHKGRLLEAVDPRLEFGKSHNYNNEKAKRLLKVGLRWCEWNQTGRPTMKDVVMT